MVMSLVRTLRGPSRDPRMAFVSRPLPKGLPDEDVVAALERALAANPDPAYLPETLPSALQEVTGRLYQVLDRSVRDVTGAYAKTQVMIRDGEVGIWPGYAARAYPLLAPPDQLSEIRAAIEAADTPGADAGQAPTSPVGKPGWKPLPPVAASPASDAAHHAAAAPEAAATPEAAALPEAEG